MRTVGCGELTGGVVFPTVRARGGAVDECHPFYRLAASPMEKFVGAGSG